jgi:hypothetical protein
MAKLFNIESRTFFSRIGFHLFDQWKPQMYNVWNFSVASFEVESYFKSNCATVRIKVLGVCLEIFLIGGKIDSNIPF